MFVFVGAMKTVCGGKAEDFIIYQPVIRDHLALLWRVIH